MHCNRYDFKTIIVAVINTYCILNHKLLLISVSENIAEYIYLYK